MGKEPVCTVHSDVSPVTSCWVCLSYYFQASMSLDFGSASPFIPLSDSSPVDKVRLRSCTICFGVDLSLQEHLYRAGNVLQVANLGRPHVVIVYGRKAFR